MSYGVGWSQCWALEAVIGTAMLHGHEPGWATRAASVSRSPEGERRLWELARKHLPPGQAGDYNQALMDLGATICTPAGSCANVRCRR